MRIQTQRETFARQIYASEFDWRPTQWEDPRDRVWNHHSAPLENGHELEAWSWHDKPQMGWSWAINKHEHPKEYMNYADAPQGGHRHFTDPEHIPDEQTAKAHAEQAYKQLFPIGTNTGPHDSGVDYSDLNSFKDHL